MLRGPSARMSDGAGQPSSAESSARCQEAITSVATSFETRLVLPAQARGRDGS